LPRNHPRPSITRTASPFSGRAADSRSAREIHGCPACQRSTPRRERETCMSPSGPGPKARGGRRGRWSRASGRCPAPERAGRGGRFLDVGRPGGVKGAPREGLTRTRPILRRILRRVRYELLWQSSVPGTPFPIEAVEAALLERGATPREEGGLKWVLKTAAVEVGPVREGGVQVATELRLHLSDRE